MLGALIIAAGGLVVLRANPAQTAPTPAGWDADPTAAAGLRYWSGSFWTEHTAGQPPAG
jgi:hypothetical protein